MTADGNTTHTSPGVADLPRLDRGTTVGRFLILEERGRGGMGVVYAAYDPELDRKVAVKLVRVERLVAGRAEWGERLLREAQAMAKVSHPNVVTVFEVGAFEDRVFLAMELIDGPTLETWVAGRAWREIVAAYVAAGRGLAAAHAAGLVHRDFKPGNVLVAGDHLPKVTDFGLAAPAEETDDAGAGTPKYMAPEQRSGEADARSDQFSFCRALEEALVGRRVPRGIRRALARGTAEDPGARFPAMDALLAELGRDRRRATVWAAGALTVAGAGAIALARPAAAPCAEAGAGVDDLWTRAVEARVGAVFQATGQGTAEDSLAAVARRMVGKPDKALPLLEEALAVREAGETPELAETRFLLARRAVGRRRRPRPGDRAGRSGRACARRRGGAGPRREEVAHGETLAAKIRPWRRPSCPRPMPAPRRR